MGKHGQVWVSGRAFMWLYVHEALASVSSSVTNRGKRRQRGPVGGRLPQPMWKRPLHWGSSCWPDVKDILKEGLIGFDDRLTVGERKILGWREEAEGEFASFSPSSPA